MGIALALNSVQAISIGSTIPDERSRTMGAPMLIWSARAPMIRAFSKRVYRKGVPRPGGGLEVTLRVGTGRPCPLRNGSPYFNLAHVVDVPWCFWPTHLRWVALSSSACGQKNLG